MNKGKRPSHHNVTLDRRKITNTTDFLTAPYNLTVVSEIIISQSKLLDNRKPPVYFNTIFGISQELTVALNL